MSSINYLSNNSVLDTTIRSYDVSSQAYADKTLTIDTTKQISDFMFMMRSPSLTGLILDIGCGPGRDSRAFSDLGYSVIGIDLSDKLLSIARNHAPKANFSKMNLSRMGFSDESFDGVWAMSVLLHLEKKDIPLALKEINRVLKPNSPFYFCLKRGIGEGLEFDQRYGVQKYYAYYDDLEIKSLIANSGFSIEQIEDATIDKKYATKPWMDIFLKK